MKKFNITKLLLLLLLLSLLRPDLLRVAEPLQDSGRDSTADDGLSFFEKKFFIIKNVIAQC